MKVSTYKINAFTGRGFYGNPAAVCPLERWPGDNVMQSAAALNNLSETAFFVPEKDGYRIRWFTPVKEIDLCGHATLASAYVIFKHLDPSGSRIKFMSKSGILSVIRKNDLIIMDFPAEQPVECAAPKELIEGLGARPQEILSSGFYLAVFSDEAEIAGMQPDMEKLKKLELTGVIVTARGKKADFVSRFFAPKYGIDEDPVTGSAHCALVPYWSGKLDKSDLHAFQLSKRGGEIFCTYLGERVLIAGRCSE